MLTSDGLIDGSWDVTVYVTDVKVEKTIKARGDLHVGGLMLRIVNALGISLQHARVNAHAHAQLALFI